MTARRTGAGAARTVGGGRGVVVDRPLSTLTVGRFVAAALVFGSHLVERFPNSPLDELGFLETVGSEAVTFFFVLSGAVLTAASSGTSPVSRFWRHRGARLAPVYAVTGIASLVFLELRGDGPSWGDTLRFFTATQAWSSTTEFAITPPAWAVSCLIFFVVVFPVLRAVVDRLPVRAFGPAAVLMLGGHLLVTRSSVSGQFPPARLLDFALGVLVGAAIRRGLGPARIAPTVALGVVTAAVALEAAVPGRTGAVPYSTLVLSSLGVAVFALARAELAGRVGAPRPLAQLGLRAYPLYLVHYLVLRVVGEGLARSNPTLTYDLVPTVGIAVACLVTSLVAAELLHRMVERPVEARLRGSGPPRRELGAPA